MVPSLVFFFGWNIMCKKDLNLRTFCRDNAVDRLHTYLGYLRYMGSSVLILDTSLQPKANLQHCIILI